jgi:uncharacterized protein (DUF697 family)
MKKENSQNAIESALNWSYTHALQGIGGSESVIELANDYLSNNPNVEEAINAMVRAQNLKSFTSGFLSGVAGLPLLPFTIPANMLSVIYMQVRMTAAIAYMRGFDLQSDIVKTMVLATLTGGSAFKFVKDATVKLTKELMEDIIKRVAIHIAAKSSAKLPVNIAKAVPVIGGIVGGAMDLVATNTIASVAKKMFNKKTSNRGVDLHGVA